MRQGSTIATSLHGGEGGNQKGRLPATCCSLPSWQISDRVQQREREREREKGLAHPGNLPRTMGNSLHLSHCLYRISNAYDILCRLFWVRNNAKNVDSKRKKPKSREEKKIGWGRMPAVWAALPQMLFFWNGIPRTINCRTDSIQIERRKK